MRQYTILREVILLRTLCDATYQHVRTLLGTRKTLFHDLQTLTRYWFFASWQDLLDFMATQLQAGQPPG